MTYIGPILEVTNLGKRFAGRGRWLRAGGSVQAVEGVSFAIMPGETLGLVGESGCGKSTTARLVMRVLEPDAGTIKFEGHDITRAGGSELRKIRPRMQMVFQDPLTSLDPRFRIGRLLEEPLLVNLRLTGGERRERTASVLERVGLDVGLAQRWPHQLSGGQRQRVGIARALMLSPALLVLDEPLSALDVSIQAQMVGLLADLQREHGLSYLLVSHDLSIIRRMSDRVAVMYLGKVVELGAADDVFESPKHPYTKALVTAVPRLDSGKRIARRPQIGDPPDPANPPSGCRFSTRCPVAIDTCRRLEPKLQAVGNSWSAACHLL